MTAKGVVGMPVQTIESSVERFAVLPADLGRHAILEYLHNLGTTIDVTEVRIKQNARSYLSSPAEVPLHTDHPDVDFILWICNEPDQEAGDSILADGWQAFLNLSTKQQIILASICLPCPHRYSFAISGHHRLIDIERYEVFFAPWLVHSDLEPDQIRAIASYNEILKRDSSLQSRIRLKAGEALLVNNHRMLHGRGQLAQTSKRWLTRFWIASHKKERETQITRSL